MQKNRRNDNNWKIWSIIIANILNNDEKYYNNAQFHISKQKNKKITFTVSYYFFVCKNDGRNDYSGFHFQSHSHGIPSRSFHLPGRRSYYLVTSSFTWFPGLPIYHSRDLTNWSLIGHALTNPKAIDFNGMTDNDGIWAPTLRYHNGTFYLITTAHGCGGNFYMTAKNPAGPWSDPVWLKDAPGIDPSLFLMRTDAVIIQAIAGILRAHGLPSVLYGCRSWTSKKRCLVGETKNIGLWPCG